MTERVQCPGCNNWFYNLRGGHLSQKPECFAAWDELQRRKVEVSDEDDAIGSIFGATPSSSTGSTGSTGSTSSTGSTGSIGSSPC